MKQKSYVAIFSIAAISLAGCTLNIGSSNTHMDAHNTSEVSNSATSQFDAQAVMFAQMMIPHHQQAVTMSELALSRSTNSEVLRLAQEIKAAQAPEIAQMRNWLEIAGAPEETGHSMMDHGMEMGGMLTDEDMAELKNASGQAFDVLFLAGMIEHHRGAIAMTSMIAQNSNAEVKTLADNIVTSQQAEISEMQALLATLR